MAREQIDAGTQSTDTTTNTDNGPVQVDYTDGEAPAWFDDYELVSEGWIKLISYDNPGHAEHGQSELVPAHRVEGLYFYDE